MKLNLILSFISIALVLIGLTTIEPSKNVANDVVAQVVLIEVDAKGDVQVNGQETPLSQLSYTLLELSAVTTTYAMLDISPDMPMGYMTELLSELRVADLPGIMYAEADEGKGMEFYPLFK